MLPDLFINFKTYEEATGKKALKLAKICEKLSKQSKKIIVVVPQLTDIKEIASSVSIPVFAQHVDPISYGQHTGFILPEAVKQAGATGTLINHSEHPLSSEEIEETIMRAKQAKLITMVFAATPEDAKQFAAYNPDILVIEPPELVGGNISVSTAKPEVITATTKAISIPVLCGAGIKNSNDVRRAIQLGAKGIGVASGVIKAADQEKALKDLISGLKEH